MIPLLIGVIMCYSLISLFIWLFMYLILLKPLHCLAIGLFWPLLLAAYIIKAFIIACKLSYKAVTEDFR